MKKSKKFLSLFAILFVAIFALSCCLFAACGNKDDDGEPTDPEITNPDDGTGGGGGSDEPEPEPEPDPEPDPEPEPEPTGEYLVTLSEDGKSFTYGYEDDLTTVEIDEKNIYVDGRLSDEDIEGLENVYNSFVTAANYFVAGTEDAPMNVYLAPYVYWIHDPTLESTTSAYGMTISCANMHWIGLTDDPQNVVIAGNFGHDEGYSGGNWTMFSISGSGFNVMNMTIGNYCCVDLEYPLDPSLSVPARTSENVTQSQIGSYSGDKLYCENVRFISRLNMMPFNNSSRALYVNCHMECTDDSLNGSSQAVYLGCDFEFYSSKPWGSASGTTLLGCSALICPINASGDTFNQYLFKSDASSYTRINVIDMDFVTSEEIADKNVTLGFTQIVPDYYRGYYSNVTLNGEPNSFDNGGSSPDAGVDITGTDFLKAYKVTDTDGTEYYNVYNLLRGSDDWDPLGQQELIESLGCEDVPTTLSLNRTTATLESGSSVSITWSVSGYHSTNYKENYSVEFSVTDEYKDYVALVVSDDGSTCTVTGTNNTDYSQVVVVEVTGSSGIVAAVAITVTPTIVEGPTVTNGVITQNNNGTATVSYDIELGGREDESRIIWYVSQTGTLSDAIQIAYGREDEPLKTISLSKGYVGYYLIATVEGKHLTSDYGEMVTVVSASVVTAEGIPDLTEYEVDIENFATTNQSQIMEGFWTLDGYKPLDSLIEGGKYERGDTVGSGQAWIYAEAVGNGMAGYAGLYNNIYGARMLYTPVAGDYGDMDMTLTIVPGKTAGQGFGSDYQYMDIFFKYDTSTLTGYSLRIYRYSSSSCGFVLVSHANGVSTEICDPVISSIYVGEVYIHIWTSNNVLYAEIASDAGKVELNANITMNNYGGFGILYAGTVGTLSGSVGANSACIYSMAVKWSEGTGELGGNDDNTGVEDDENEQTTILEFDFANADDTLKEKINTDASSEEIALDNDGVFSFKEGSSSTLRYNSGDKGFYFNGAGGTNTYIKLNLEDYIGWTVTISVSMESNTNNSSALGVYLNTKNTAVSNLSEDELLASAVAAAEAGATASFEITLTITVDNCVFYLLGDNKTAITYLSIVGVEGETED